MADSTTMRRDPLNEESRLVALTERLSRRKLLLGLLLLLLLAPLRREVEGVGGTEHAGRGGLAKDAACVEG